MTKNLVSADEQSLVSRKLLLWLNSYPNKPTNRIDYEYLSETYGLAISTIQAAYKLRQYIAGGYRAQYQFKIVFRTIPTTNDERLAAEELVNSIGSWASEHYKDLLLGDGIKVISVARDTVGALFARYEGGVEDYQILMNLVYEVNV